MKEHAPSVDMSGKSDTFTEPRPQAYIGTKIITAVPQNLNGAEGYAVIYADGYKSWSPKAQFDDAYRAVAGASLTFSHALDLLKRGNSVTRRGWNGKDVYIYLNKGSHDFDSLSGLTVDGIDCDLFDEGLEGTATRLPNINMRSVSGATVTGWLASQTDMLASDWEVVG
jgi:hypothetical protein